MNEPRALLLASVLSWTRRSRRPTANYVCHESTPHNPRRCKSGCAAVGDYASCRLPKFVNERVGNPQSNGFVETPLMPSALSMSWLNA